MHGSSGSSLIGLLDAVTWSDCCYTLIPVTELAIFWVLTYYSMRAIRRTIATEASIRLAPGYKIRQLFLIWVTAALLIKVVLLVFWILVEAILTYKKHLRITVHGDRTVEAQLSHHKGWIRNLCRLLPNLLFLTSYLLVVGLWINACIKSRMKPSNAAYFDESRVGTIIVLSNLCLYATFFVVTAVELVYQDYELFRTMGFYVVGIAYLALCCAWTYWGFQCIMTLNERTTQKQAYGLDVVMMSSEGDKTRPPLRKDPTLQNMERLVPTGSVLFLVKGVYNLLVATGVLDRYAPLAFPSLTRLQTRLVWDGIFGCLTEALPIGIVVYMCSPDTTTRPRPTTISQSRRSLQNLLAERNLDHYVKVL